MEENLFFDDCSEAATIKKDRCISFRLPGNWAWYRKAIQHMLYEF